MRFRHIRARPQVSATHLPGEELAVTAHGRAELVDITGEEGAGFRQTLLEVYVPRYGAEWEEFLDSGPLYARIEAERMFSVPHALGLNPLAAQRRLPDGRAAEHPDRDRGRRPRTGRRLEAQPRFGVTLLIPQMSCSPCPTGRSNP